MGSNHHDLNLYMPPEIILQLLPFLTQTELSRLSQTCKLYRTLFLQPLFTNISLTTNSSLNAFNKIFGINCTLDWPERLLILSSKAKVAYKDIALFGLPNYINLNLGSLVNRYIPLVKTKEKLITVPKQHPMKTMLIPYDRSINHRLKGGVYGIITARSKSRYKDMNLNVQSRPCLQFPTLCRGLGSGNEIGKLIQSLTVDNTDISDKVLTAILGNLRFLNTLKIKDCKLISDVTCKSISNCSYLTKLYLIGLPRVTNAGLVWISKCLNLEYLSLKNTLEISEVGLKHIFYSCPFLRHLDLERLGSGNGFGIGKEIVPYLISYAQTLNEIVLSGCMLDTDALKTLCQKSKIQKFWVSYSTVRTRDLEKIKEIVQEWMSTDLYQINLDSFERGRVIGLMFKDLRQIVIRG